MPTHHFREEEPVEDESGTTVVMTTPPLPPPVIAPEDQKLHEDAKRFARLLVSEIKLYNEAQVTAGREHKDLYDRLKDDIERSRRMYQERVPENIHSTTNYFYEELVRTLANGDPTLLGM
jgi:predicted transcriptional regulator